MNNRQPGQDRRSRRTKALLTDALLTLLETRDLKDISVKELCEKADINRGTFYLHYHDIYEMMEQVERELLAQFDGFLSGYTAEELHMDPYPLIYDMFQFTADNARLFRVLLGSHGNGACLSSLKGLVRDRFLHDWLGKAQGESCARLEYSYDFLAAGWTGLIESWLFSGRQEPIAEMAALAGSIIETGIRSLI